MEVSVGFVTYVYSNIAVFRLFEREGKIKKETKTVV